MNPKEFTSFDKQMPDLKKHLIVTNNLDAQDAHGEMSHIWLTIFFTKGSQDGDGLVTFDEADRKICGLTHWKYA